MRDFASLRRRRTLPQSWFRPVLSGWTRHSPFAQCFPALRHHEAGHCSLSDFSRYFTFAAPAHTLCVPQRAVAGRSSLRRSSSSSVSPPSPNTPRPGPLLSKIFRHAFTATGIQNPGWLSIAAASALIFSGHCAGIARCGTRSRYSALAISVSRRSLVFLVNFLGYLYGADELHQPSTVDALGQALNEVLDRKPTALAI